MSEPYAFTVGPSFDNSKKTSLAKVFDELAALRTQLAARDRALAEACELLRPFARLGGPDDGSGTPKYHDLPDDIDVYENSGAIINAGHVRAAHAFLARRSGSAKGEGT